MSGEGALERPKTSHGKRSRSNAQQPHDAVAVHQFGSVRDATSHQGAQLSTGKPPANHGSKPQTGGVQPHSSQSQQTTALRLSEHSPERQKVSETKPQQHHAENVEESSDFDRPKTSRGSRGRRPLDSFQDDIENDVYIPFQGTERPRTSRGRNPHDSIESEGWGHLQGSSGTQAGANTNNQVNILTLHVENLTEVHEQNKTQQNIENRARRCSNLSKTVDETARNISRKQASGIQNNPRQSTGKRVTSKITDKTNKPIPVPRRSVEKERRNPKQPVPTPRQSIMRNIDKPKQPLQVSTSSINNKNGTQQIQTPSHHGPVVSTSGGGTVEDANLRHVSQGQVVPSGQAVSTGSSPSGHNTTNTASVTKQSLDNDTSLDQVKKCSNFGSNRPDSSTSLSRYSVLPGIGPILEPTTSTIVTTPAQHNISHSVTTSSKEHEERSNEDLSMTRQENSKDHASDGGHLKDPGEQLGQATADVLVSGNDGHSQHPESTVQTTTSISSESPGKTEKDQIQLPQDVQDEHKKQSESLDPVLVLPVTRLDSVDSNKPVTQSSSSDFHFNQLTRTITLPPEPSKDEAVILLAVKLPNGKRAERNFSPTNILLDVLNFAELSSKLDFSNCELVCGVSRRRFKDLDVTIKDCNLENRTLLLVQLPDK